MDIVISYVDGRDPNWQKDYEKYTDIPLLDKRFRDWGTLKYLLRGVQANMPFIRNVFLVVSHPTQVPDWIGPELKIVLHKDFIPEKYLPTFNSTTIGLHLHRIPGLDEEFIYFNDDIYPVRPVSASDFFRNGKLRVGISRHLFVSGMYKQHCRQSNVLARELLGKWSSPFFIRAQHCCIPMFRSTCEKVYDSLTEKIDDSITRVRSEKNLNMALYMSYLYYSHRVIPRRISCKHISMAVASPASIASFIRKPTRDMVCINDVQLSEEKYNQMRTAILEAFEDSFPTKSRFEK